MKTGYLNTLMGLLCMLALTISCAKEESYDNEEILEPITIGKNMEATTIEVELPMKTISNEWYANSPSADTWLTHEVKPETKTMWIMLDANTTGVARSSFINVRSKGQFQKILITQDSEAVITLSRSNANFRYIGGARTVKVMNADELKNISFTIESDWCSAELKDNSIVVTALENATTTVREAELTVTANRVVSGDPTSYIVELTQDEYGKLVSYECSADGGKTWIDDIPEEFDTLTVRNVEGAKITADDLETFKAAIDSQSEPAGLDLSNAEYAETTFPVTFSGLSSRPNTTLKYIKFPSNVTSIASGAFQNCKALEGVDLTGITNIGDAAFRYCGLKTLNVPNSVATHGTYIFADNEALTSVYWNATNDGEKVNYYTFYIDNASQTAQMTMTIGADAAVLPRTFLRHNNNLVKLVFEKGAKAMNYFLVQCEYLESIHFLSKDAADIAKISCATLWDTGHIRCGAKAQDKTIFVPGGCREQYIANSMVNRLLNDAGYSIEEVYADDDDDSTQTPGTGENPGTPGDDEPVVTPPASSTLPGTSWSDIK